MSASSSTLRNVQIGAAFIAFVLVVVLAPRMDGPRMIGGVAFENKTGGPGLTNLGWPLLVVTPMATYLVVGLVGRVLARWRSR